MMEQKLLFSRLDNIEKTLVRSRFVDSGSGNRGGVTSGINFKPASDKLEANLINETPLCDVVESFVYPRIVDCPVFCKLTMSSFRSFRSFKP